MSNKYQYLSIGREVMSSDYFWFSFNLPNIKSVADVKQKSGFGGSEINGHKIDKVMVFSDESLIFIVDNETRAILYESPESQDIIKNIGI